MYVKTMVLEGFKSYGQRVQIDGFDPAFNAITGLNGSGKSNILDGICFLMGITNLSCVRAENLQALVYKNGQAGVTKASVTITFDNRDKKQSPLGYEQYDEVSITRQVVIGGKNKYLINGANVQANRVKDFFCSVQLNVNNPHFLIMQGRITKVLNMKPPEILSMIEEAAGTRMYEAKKQQAEKTIEKKDARLKEIDAILNEEINPTLKKLREERSAYLEYQKIQRELEHLTKLYLAWKFVCAEEANVKTKEELEKIQQAIKDIAKAVEEGEVEERQLQEEIKELERARDQDLGDNLADKDNALKEKEKTEAKAASAVKTLKDNIKQEERKRKQVEKSLADDRKGLATKEKNGEGMQAMFDQLREEDERCKAELELAQKKYQAASLGETIVEGGGSATLQEQVMTFKQNISKAETEIKTADTKKKHNDDQLQKKQIEMKKTEAVYKRDTSSLGKFQQAVAELQGKLGQLTYEEGTLEKLEAEVRPAQHRVNGLRQTVEGGENRFNGLRFEYRDPDRGFDRRRVHGVAAKLFEIRDTGENIDFSTALETGAGGKLYNVVVDTDDTANALLKRGNLQQRKTFIPLNKISTQDRGSRVIQAAVRAGGPGNVWAPMDLVQYDQQVERAIVHLFGNVLICRDLDTAKKVAYDRQVNMPCVTLLGDNVSPDGAMSGGAQKTGGSVLSELQRQAGKRRELEEAQAEVEAIQRRIQEVQHVAEKFNTINQQLEVKQAELEAINARLQQTPHFQLAQEVKQLQEDTAAVIAGVEKAKTDKKEWEKTLKDLQYRIDNAEKIRDQEMKAADKEVKAAKKKAEESKAKWSAKEQEEKSLQMELEGLRTSIAEAEEKLQAVALAMQQWGEQISEAEDTLVKVQEEVQAARAEVKEQKDALAKNSKALQEKSVRKDKILKERGAHGLKTQEKEHEATKAKEEVRDAKHRVEGMLAEYEWIADDRKFFGQPNTHYDFKATDPKEAGQKIQKLEATKDKLSKNVNMRAMNMLGKAEEQCADLVKKKKIVEGDKKKITLVIKELDEKKKQALRTAWDQVNKDFGSIFSNLLPGTTAKLEPPAGQDVLDGLEVKVAFGGKWKDSLSELSGGQRSLVALSLILALLLFKPAPLYILDEVDSALDLSHTQNIGQMLKNHFKHSQFIVVSLKDGMFNNANVLFRTKFVDGMSTVSRTTQDQNRRK